MIKSTDKTFFNEYNPKNPKYKNKYILIEEMKQYLAYLKDLYNTNPEVAKKEIKESLMKIGLIDENYKLLQPYNGKKIIKNNFTQKFDIGVSELHDMEIDKLYNKDVIADTLKYIKKNGFEIQTMYMGSKTIAKLFVDDNNFVAGTKFHRLIVVNKQYVMDDVMDAESFKNIIINAIEEFIKYNDGKLYLKNIEFNKNIFKSYVNVISNSQYYTNKTHELVLLMREKGFSNLGIGKFLEDNCRKELVDIYNSRENLISRNRERSKYLKKKYEKKK